MKIKLLAHTQLAEDFNTGDLWFDSMERGYEYTGGQLVALTAIRTCYSHNNPSEIVELEGKKYFGTKAKEGEGTDADRLIRHIINSGHTSTMEHINFTFAIEGVSRSLLAQLTRHRHFSYSVQSQRYVKFGSEDKSNGATFAIPQTWRDKIPNDEIENMIEFIQEMYDDLRKEGVPAEDARYILPNAATCNLVLTGNLRSFLEFYSKRNPNTHAQWEIQEFAEKLKEEIIKVEPWTETFFKA